MRYAGLPERAERQHGFERAFPSCPRANDKRTTSFTSTPPFRTNNTSSILTFFLVALLIAAVALTPFPFERSLLPHKRTWQEGRTKGSKNQENEAPTPVSLMDRQTTSTQT